MRKILQINSCVGIYSTGRIVEDIGNAIIAKGWDSYVAFGRTARKSNSELIRIGTNLDILLHGLQTRLFDRQGLGSIGATEKLIEKLTVLDPDIVHIHNIHDYYINYPLLFKYLNSVQIPIVWTFHDFWPVTGHCAHFSRTNCEKWKIQCYDCPQTSEYPASFLLDNSRSNFRQKKDLFSSIQTMVIVSVSDWVADTLRYSFLSGRDIRVIKNGVDVNLFKPQLKNNAVREKYNVGGRMMLLGVATSWGERKGLNDYYRLSDQLREDEVIVLVGLTRKQLLQIPLNIIGIERTEDLDELVALYSEADVVLNLSYEETFGLTTIEGFACGTPGIVYNCTASPELVNTETGIVVETGRLSGVLDAIGVIKGKGKSYYSRACRKCAVDYYNKDDRYQDYIDLYESILTKQNTNIRL